LKILLFANTDWYLFNYRLELAQALRAKGHDVVLVSPEGKFTPRLRELGFRLVPFAMSRRGLNLIVEFFTLVRLVRLYSKEKPDLVHHFTVKCVLYGSLACYFAGIRSIINSVEGLGYVFTEGVGNRTWLRGVVKLVYRLVLRPTWVIFLNPDDLQYFLDFHLVNPRKTVLIPGTGVDTRRFLPHPETLGVPLVILPARLLWDKGVGEFVEAARQVRSAGLQARFALVGDPDEGNPGSVKVFQLQSWEKEGAIEFWGWKENMEDVFLQASVVCLPTYYREGLPKSLIEAMACGRPIITTNVPGCREIIRRGENGLLVDARDISALVEALKYLVQNPDIRKKMGAAGRMIAEREYSSERIIPQILAVYQSSTNG
jgi:glycosyltransferase involved in cell wall biosynthesis